MPIYEYRCSTCLHRFELLQRLGETGDGLLCPNCGAGAVVKQFSTFAGMASDRSSSQGGLDAGCGETSCCRASTGFS